MKLIVILITSTVLLSACQSEVRCVKDKNGNGDTVYYGMTNNGKLVAAPKGCGR